MAIKRAYIKKQPAATYIALPVPKKRKPRSRYSKLGDSGFFPQKEAYYGRTAPMATAYGRKRATGSGDYMIKGDTPFGTVGKHLGSYFGQPNLGFAAGHLIGNVLGSGDYAQSNKTDIPTFGGSGRMTNITHREYVGDIVTGDANTFKVQGFKLNPGLPQTFPWLSTIAGNYEQYRIRGMIWSFKTTSSDSLNSTNTALGTVIMGTDYNAATPLYGSKIQMENSEFSQSAKPSLSQAHGIECAPSEGVLKNYFVRVGAVPANEDSRMYDFATFQIATAGFQAANVVVGELWCSYDIEFLKPQMTLNRGGNNRQAKQKRTSLATTSLDLGVVGVQRSGLISSADSTASSIRLKGLVIGNNYGVTINSAANVAITTGYAFGGITGGFAINAYPDSVNMDAASFVSLNSGGGGQSSLQFAFQAAFAEVDLFVTSGVLASSGSFNCEWLVYEVDQTIL